jgi:putative phosphoesterase
MKLLVGSDLHNNARAKVWFCNLADREKPDAIVFLGDFITFEPLSFARDVMRDFASLGIPVLAIPGNCDPRDVLLDIDHIEGITNLHNTTLTMQGLKFTGHGGSITCPSPTPFEEPDANFAKPLENLIEGTDILVLHQPVRGFRDFIVGVGNVGSESVRALLSQYRPRVVFSGHIHEAKGMDEWGHTYFINPGALLSMCAAVVELDGRLQTRFIEGEE